MKQGSSTEIVLWQIQADTDLKAVGNHDVWCCDKILCVLNLPDRLR